MTPPGPVSPAGGATMSVARANLLALLWLPACGLLAAGPFVLLWGPDALTAAPLALPPLLLGLAILAAGIVTHELLHAVGFLVFGRAPRGLVRIGFQRRTLTPFATCRAPVTASAYRAAALLPAAVLGGLPVLLSWLTGSGVLLLWGWLMLALAGGDVAALWAIRTVPGPTLVLDHPTLVGCRPAADGAATTAAS